MNISLKEFVEKRDAIVKYIDVQTAIEEGMLNPKSHRDVQLGALHKARYEITSMPRCLRLLSRIWLERHNMVRVVGDFPENFEELPL